MNKSRFFLRSGWLAAAALSLSAPVAAPAAPAGVAVTATGLFATDYMFRGQRLQGPSLQPTVEMTSGNLTLGVWASFPIDDRVPGSSDPEIDPYGSYTFALNDQASLAPGFTLYTYPSADKAAGFYRTTFEPNLAFNYTVAGLKLTPKLYYDFVLEGPVWELTAFYALPLQDLGTELDFIASYGTYKFDEFAENSRPSTKAWGNYWLIGITMPFQITASQKVTLGVTYTEGTNAWTKVGSAPRSPNTLAMDRVVGTLSYSFAF